MIRGIAIVERSFNPEDCLFLTIVISIMFITYFIWSIIDRKGIIRRPYRDTKMSIEKDVRENLYHLDANWESIFMKIMKTAYIPSEMFSILLRKSRQTISRMKAYAPAEIQAMEKIIGKDIGLYEGMFFLMMIDSVIGSSPSKGKKASEILSEMFGIVYEYSDAARIDKLNAERVDLWARYHVCLGALSQLYKTYRGPDVESAILQGADLLYEHREAAVEILENIKSN